MKKLVVELLRLVFLLTFAFLSGCMGIDHDPSHLIFYEDLSFGFNAKGSPAQGGSLDASLGYTRDTTTIIPKSRTLSEGKECANIEKVSNGATNGSSSGSGTKSKIVCPQAMSVISKSLFDIGWFGNNQIKLHFATGQAAQNLAGAPNGVGSLDGTQKEKK